MIKIKIKTKYHLIDGRLVPASYNAAYDVPIVPPSEEGELQFRALTGQAIIIKELSSLSDLHEAIAEYSMKHCPRAPLRLYCSAAATQKIRKLVQPYLTRRNTYPICEDDKMKLFGLDVYTAACLSGFSVVVI